MKKVVLTFVVTAALGSPALFAQGTPMVSSHPPANTAAAGSKPANWVVARVNGSELTQRDLQREMQKLFPYAGVHGGRVPGEYGAEVRRRALDQIVFDELVFQDAKRRKMVVPGSLFNDILTQAKGRFKSKAEFESYATQEYGSVQGFEKMLRRGILIALLTEREITQKAKVTDAQVRQFYDQNRQRFQKPETVWIQSISLNFPADAVAAQRAQIRKRAEELLPKARAAKTYEDFGRLAEKYSEDDWRIMMGDHRWIHRGRLPSAVEAVAFRLNTGDVSAIIETSEALVLVRINGKQPQTQIPFAQASPSLREDLEKAKLGDLRRKFEQQLRKTYVVAEIP